MDDQCFPESGVSDIRDITYSGAFGGCINDDVCFRDSLKKIIIKPRTLKDFGAPDDTIAEIFRLVLPKLVNLRTAIINTPGIEWLKLIPAEPMLPLKFLHTVDMTYDFKNPSRVDKEALLKFLEKHNGVYNLGGGLGVI